MMLSTEYENCRHFEPLAAAVALGRRVRDVAVDLEISESAAYHLSGSREFKQRVAAIRTEATQIALGKLTNAATAAVDVLIELMAASELPSTRIKAACKILDSLGSIGELADLRLRIEALEPKT